MNKTTLAFKVSTILISIIDISTLVYFIVTLISVLSNKIILAKGHLVLLITALIINSLYVIYLIIYLIIHKKR